MPECELCGKETILYDAIVEGSSLKVCKICSKFGKVIILEKPRIIVEESRILPEEQIQETISLDYSTKVKEARESFKLTQEELALKIKTKENLIKKIESGSMKPDIVLAKRLENFLKIKLIENYHEINPKKLNFKDSNLTIGDIIKL